MAKSRTSQLEFPQTLIERWRDIWPEADFERIWQTFLRPLPTVFRLNSLKADVDRLQEYFEEYGLAPDTHPEWPDVWRVNEEKRSLLTALPAATTGELYIQNLASLYPVKALDPAPSDHVLDLAAAPGGKTSYLAALMKNGGKIAAVEKIKPRFFRLRANLERLGVTNTRTFLKDGSGVGYTCPEWFDKVLLDAPCSSEAPIRIEDPRTWRHWRPRKISEMAQKQAKLLESAFFSLKPGGRLVYATCSFAPEENEARVDDLLTRFPGMLEIEETRFKPELSQAGMVQWRGRTFHPDLVKAVRVLPDDWHEGFFFVCLRKLHSTKELQAERRISRGKGYRSKRR